MTNIVRQSRICSIVVTSLLAALPACNATGHGHGAPITLPSYNVDPAQTSISGLSSGAFMAAQMHVAYSATFKAGAGIVAGGPFYCAQGSVVTATGPCMAATSSSKPATSSLISTTNTWAGQGLIDATSNLANSGSICTRARSTAPSSSW